ncbi:MAG: c-type cytochrome [Telluria sp.]
MKTWIKSVAAAAGALALLLLALFAAGMALGERRLARSVTVPVSPVVLRGDAAHIERGRYLFATRGCADCHGANGAGKEVFNGGGMLVVAPNITRGANSATAGYTTLDWVRTLRHGVKPGGAPVQIMPSEDYNRLTDADTAALIAYALQLPPVDGKAAQLQLPWIVKVQYGFGLVHDAAEKIDHALPPSTPQAATAPTSPTAASAATARSWAAAGFPVRRRTGRPPPTSPRQRQRDGAVRHAAGVQGDAAQRPPPQRQRSQHGDAVRLAARNERHRPRRPARLPAHAAAAHGRTALAGPQRGAGKAVKIDGFARLRLSCLLPPPVPPTPPVQKSPRCGACHGRCWSASWPRSAWAWPTSP